MRFSCFLGKCLSNTLATLFYIPPTFHTPQRPKRKTKGLRKRLRLLDACSSLIGKRKTQYLPTPESGGLEFGWKNLEKKARKEAQQSIDQNCTRGAAPVHSIAIIESRESREPWSSQGRGPEEQQNWLRTWTTVRAGARARRWLNKVRQDCATNKTEAAKTAARLHCSPPASIQSRASTQLPAPPQPTHLLVAACWHCHCHFPELASCKLPVASGELQAGEVLAGFLVSGFQLARCDVIVCGIIACDYAARSAVQLKSGAR